MSASGLIIAAPSSGSGKTTVTLGLLRALRNEGFAVASAKAGPDYIDPTFHARASGRPCINLDPWAMRPQTLSSLLGEITRDTELVICEGVMGLFDGTGPSGDGSTAALAALTGWPVVLVVDARALAASAAAVVSGFACPPQSLSRAGLRIAGVIFNRTGGDTHTQLLRATMREALPEIPVLGCIPRTPGLELPGRHLGLVPANEAASTEAVIANAGQVMARSVDLAALRALAQSSRMAGQAAAAPLPPLGQRIAIARDDAFVFAYPWVLEGWRAAGAELSFFSPLTNETPSSASDAIYLPGGYPELHAGKLAANGQFIGGLRFAAERGVTIYGECGGYMMLGEALVDANGARHAMADLLPVTTSFAERRLHLGYRALAVTNAGRLGPAGARFRGHEFHYATILEQKTDDTGLFTAHDANGRALPRAGHRTGQVMGSFIHLLDRATP